LDYAAFILILALGIIVLIRRNDLTSGEIGATAILILIFAFFSMLVLLGTLAPQKLSSVLIFLARIVNAVARRFIHRAYIDEGRAVLFAEEVSEGLTSIRHYPKRLIQPILFSLLNKTLLVFVVLLMFVAFKVPFSAGTIIGGFSIGYLFQIVSVTPSGVGIMESVFALGLKSLGVNWSQAIIITFAYRAVTLWFPLGIGAIAFRQIEKENKAQA
jgi:glycosyltransferase 2 family protein